MIHTAMFQKNIHVVKFYPSADDFTQAPLVMLVTNIMSEAAILITFIIPCHHFLSTSLSPLARRCELYKAPEPMHVSLMIVNLQGPLLFPGSSSSSRVIIKLNGSLLSPGILF